MAGGRRLPPHLHRGRLAPGADGGAAADAQPHLEAAAWVRTPPLPVPLWVSRRKDGSHGQFFVPFAVFSGDLVEVKLTGG